jgi:hypothetical protein
MVRGVASSLAAEFLEHHGRADSRWGRMAMRSPPPDDSSSHFIRERSVGNHIRHCPPSPFAVRRRADATISSGLRLALLRSIGGRDGVPFGVGQAPTSHFFRGAAPRPHDMPFTIVNCGSQRCGSASAGARAECRVRAAGVSRGEAGNLNRQDVKSLQIVLKNEQS